MKAKSKDVIEMEKAAEALEREIVRFTNIDTEKFTHAFRGVSISVNAGETIILRMSEADHLALHLARKIIAREKKSGIAKDDTVPLFQENEIIALKKKILERVATEENNVRKTPEQIRAEELEMLKQKYDKQFKPKPVPKNPIVSNTANVTKKQVIKDLQNRGIKVDYTKTKAELLEQVKLAEMEGNTA